METQSQPILEVRDLECRDGERVILRNVSFAVHRGEMFFVVGRDGVGKTTLLRYLIGLETPHVGSVRYFGTNLADCGWTEKRRLLMKFGVVFQHEGLWDSKTLAGNISLPLEEHVRMSRKTREDLIALKLAQVGLSGFQDCYPSELVGAMRKRAALARALALEPALLLCDEPTGGLDPVQARQIDLLLQDIREGLGVSVVVLSHNLSSIMNVADRLIFLDEEAKGIVAEGPPAELARSNVHPRLEEFFKPQQSKSGLSR